MAASAHRDAALISLHPRHAESILSGAKRAEFRKVRLQREVDLVIVYVTAPISKVVAVFEVKGVVVAPPQELWQRYSAVAGITEAEFSTYYAGRESGVAIVVGDVQRLHEPLPLGALGPIKPPQSFQYVPAEAAAGLLSRSEAKSQTLVRRPLALLSSLRHRTGGWLSR